MDMSIRLTSPPRRGSIGINFAIAALAAVCAACSSNHQAARSSPTTQATPPASVSTPRSPSATSASSGGAAGGFCAAIDTHETVMNDAGTDHAGGARAAAQTLQTLAANAPAAVKAAAQALAAADTKVANGDFKVTSDPAVARDLFQVTQWVSSNCANR
jgi:hypothetical protein